LADNLKDKIWTGNTHYFLKTLKVNIPPRVEYW
jgi:hypothetical protein